MVSVKESLDDKFQRFKNRISVSEKRMRDERKPWDQAVDAYNGNILTTENSDFSQFLTQVNLWYVDVRSSTPKLYSRNPYIYIDPEVPEADLAAEVYERVVNGKLDDWKLKTRMRALVQGTKMKGRAYLKTSYRFDQDKIARDFYGEQENDDCVIDYVSRERLLIDPFAPSFEKRRYAAHLLFMPIQEIRRKWKIKEDDKPNIVEEADLPEKFSSEDREDFKYGKVFEIEDLETKELSVIVDGIDRFAEKPYEHPYKFSMYDALEWNDIPDVLNTKTDLEFWYKLLLELAETRTQQINHRRKLNSKYLWTGPTGPTPAQRAQIETYKDGSFVELKPGESITPLQHAQLGAEVYSAEQGLRQDISIVSAMNEMRQGLPQIQKTAREAMAIYSESQDVMSERSSRVDDVVSSVAGKCIKLMQKNYDKTRVIAMTSMEEVEFMGLKEKYKSLREGVEVKGSAGRPFLSFVGTKLPGEFKVRIKAGSARPADEGQRKEEILAGINSFKQAPQIAARVNWDELIKETAKSLHLDTKKILMTPKTPTQENVLLKQGIPVMPMLNEPHDEHLGDHELENNNTPAFIMHIAGHRLLKSFLEKHQPSGGGSPVPDLGGRLPMGVSPTNIPGAPIGAAQPGPVVVPSPQGVSSQAQTETPVLGEM